VLYLSRIASTFVAPLGFCLLAGLLGLLLLLRGKRRSGLAISLASLALLWVAATPLAARLSLGILENRYPIRSAAETPPADIAIVLGGVLEGAIPPRKAADLGEASDRILFAAELFRAGKVRKLLISGGNLPWKGDSAPESEAIRDIMIGWGIPADAIITETLSRTTAENARMVGKLWPSLGAGSALLVTSAAHMPRALATFRHAGLPVIPAATDVRSVRVPFQILDVLPDSDSLKDTSGAAKEFIGYGIYWLRGDL